MSKELLKLINDSTAGNHESITMLMKIIRTMEERITKLERMVEILWEEIKKQAECE